MTGTPGQDAGPYMLLILAPFVAVWAYEMCQMALSRLFGERCTCCGLWTRDVEKGRVGLCEGCIADGAHYMTTIDPVTGEMEG